jgi:hypothetical protein
LLVYYPLHDLWHSTGDLIRQNPIPKSFTNTVTHLWEHGYAFDYVSDRFLAKAECKNGKISVGGSDYSAILIPDCKIMSETTLATLTELARQGTTVFFHGHLPSDVPGWGKLDQRRKRFQDIVNTTGIGKNSNTNSHSVCIGKGAFVVLQDLQDLNDLSRLKREPGASSGLRFVRRRSPDGFNYFLANRSQKAFDGWVPLAQSFKSAVILDLRAPARTGTATIKSVSDQTSLYLQLQPGESCIVKVFTKRTVSGAAWSYWQKSGSPLELKGTWKVRFMEGGPELPHEIALSNLVSWTETGDAEAKRFAGTALYTLEFETPRESSVDWLLDLGKVCDSARVRLNGKPVGAFWCAPFKAAIGQHLWPGKNTLEVEVTNLAANRIADLDRRKVKWKYFYDINMASKRYRSFDASEWPTRDSGLIGPVTLAPLRPL